MKQRSNEVKKTGKSDESYKSKSSGNRHGFSTEGTEVGAQRARRSCAWA
jgi:hypothetical protein